MKRSIKRILVAVFGTAVLVGGLTACGGHHGGWGRMGGDSTQARERMIERAGKELKLDDAQKQRLTVLADKLRDSRSAVMGATDPRADMMALVAGPKFDRTNAQALVEAKAAAVRAKSPEVIAAAADFFDGLRPDQQQQVREYMSKRGGRGGHGRKS
jgi:Spy/CpxP family protein refolding chaperone